MNPQDTSATSALPKGALDLTRAVVREWELGMQSGGLAFNALERTAAIIAPIIARADRLAIALQLIVDKHDCASELFTSDKELADNLRDTAALALKQDRNDNPQTPRP